jgi:hypothetical protein
LPAAGRKGKAPAFPLTIPRGSTKAVRALWKELWATPQADAWESLGWTRVIARYTLKAIEAEKPLATASLLSEVRQLEDRLGLTPMSMKRLQWEIAEPQEGNDQESPADDVNFTELYGGT